MLQVSKSKAATGAICSIAAIVTLVVNQHPEIRTPPEALQIIGDAEGCRRDPYMCQAGVLTDGVGNTHNVKAGKSLDQIAADWARNIAEAERCINRHFNGADMPDLTFGAMTSAAFNMGCGNLMTYRTKTGARMPTTIWQLAKLRDWRGMCGRMMDFTRGGGRVWPGLVKRRAKEQALCLRGLSTEGESK